MRRHEATGYTSRAGHEENVPRRPVPHRLHRSHRLRDGHPVPLVLRARVRRERHDGRGGGRHLLDHAVLLRAGVGTAVGPHRTAAGDPDQPHRELRRLLSLRASRTASTLLFLSRIIAGAGGANIGTAQAYIADTTTPENRAKGMGLIGAAFGMGFILGPPLSGILSHVGTKHGMAGNLLPGVAAGSLSLIALLIALLRPRRIEGARPAAAQRHPAAVRSSASGARWRTHGLLLGRSSPTLFLTLLAVAGMETSVTLHARDRFHFTQLDLAWFFLFMGVIVATIQGGLIGTPGQALRREDAGRGRRRVVHDRPGARARWSGACRCSTSWRSSSPIGQGLCYPSLTSLVTKASPRERARKHARPRLGDRLAGALLGPIWCGFLYDLAQARGAFYGGAVLTASRSSSRMRMRKQLPARRSGRIDSRMSILKVARLGHPVLRRKRPTSRSPTSKRASSAR